MLSCLALVVEQPLPYGPPGYGGRECRWCSGMRVLAVPGQSGVQPFLPHETHAAGPLNAAIAAAQLDLYTFDSDIAAFHAQIASYQRTINRLTEERAQTVTRLAAWRPQSNAIAAFVQRTNEAKNAARLERLKGMWVQESETDALSMMNDLCDGEFLDVRVQIDALRRWMAQRLEEYEEEAPEAWWGALYSAELGDLNQLRFQVRSTVLRNSLAMHEDELRAMSQEDFEHRQRYQPGALLAQPSDSDDSESESADWSHDSASEAESGEGESDSEALNWRRARYREDEEASSDESSASEREEDDCGFPREMAVHNLTGSLARSTRTPICGDTPCPARSRRTTSRGRPSPRRCRYPPSRPSSMWTRTRRHSIRDGRRKMRSLLPTCCCQSGSGASRRRCIAAGTRKQQCKRVNCNPRVLIP